MNRTAIKRTAWLVCAAAMILAAAIADEPVPQVQRSLDEVPPTQGIIDFLAPEGTRFRYNGEDNGTERRLRLGRFEPNTSWVYEIEATLPDGKTSKRRVLLQGGWHVRLDFQRPARPEIVYQTGHTSWRINGVAFSPDGRLVLTGGDDKCAALWETTTGRQLAAFQGHSLTSVMAVAFSPDGRTALTGGYNGVVTIWDVDKTTVLASIRLTEKAIASLAFAPSGKWFVAAATDGKASVWDATTYKQLATLEGHTDVVMSVAVAPDGRRIATGSLDRTAALWDAASGRRLKVLNHEKVVPAVAFVGDCIVTASGNEAQLWDADAERVERTFTGHSDVIRTIATSRDGKLLATGSVDRTARVWDMTTGAEVSLYEGHTAAVTAIALSPDGRLVATGGADTAGAVFEARGGRSIARLRGNVVAVNSVAFGPGSKELVAFSEDGTGTVWDLGRSQPVLLLDSGDGKVEGGAFSGDGRTIVAVHENLAVVWDRASGEIKRRLRGNGNVLRSAAVSRDGRTVVAASDDRTAIVWDAESGEIRFTLAGHTDKLHSVTMSPNGRLIATSSGDRTAIIWDAQTGTQLMTLQGHEKSLGGLAFSPDGRRIATTGADLQTIVWDVATGRRLAAMRGRDEFITGVAVAFSPDSTKILTTYCANAAVLWDINTGRIVHELIGHRSCVWSAGYTPDGRHLLTASRDGTVRLWDAATGDETVRLVSLERGREWLAVTPDGYFDGSPAGTEKVALRPAGTAEVLPVDRFRQHYARPGLIASVLKGRLPDPAPVVASPAAPVAPRTPAPVAPVVTARPTPAAPPPAEHPAVRPEKRRPPLVRFVSPRESGSAPGQEVEIEIEATDQGGGIRPESLRLTHNGITRRAMGSASGDAKALRQRFRVSLLEGENRFEATATSKDGTWESEPAALTLAYGKTSARGVLHVLAVGINRYAQGAMDLKYARPDAEAIASLFESRGGRLFSSVRVTQLLDADATRDGIRNALKALAAKAGPQDTVVVYYAGHGLMVGQLYYLIPHDFQRKGNSLEDDVREQGLAANVLTEEMTALKATRQVLIVDACASGGLIGNTGASRGGLEFRGAIERLGRSSGVFTLAAAASSGEAKEVDDLKHGVLTYALLAAVRAAPHGDLRNRPLTASSDDGAADVLSWFNYARGHVPRLTKKYCGHEQQVQSFGRGSSFPLLPLEE